MKFFLFLGAAQSYFWCFLIFKKPRKQFADKLLQATMFLAGTFILIDFLQETQYNYKFMPHLPIINSCLPLLFGPLMLLYIQHHGENKPLNWIHFLPFLLSLLLYLPFLIMPPSELLLQFNKWLAGDISYSHKLRHTLQEILTVFSGLFYSILCWRALKKHQQRLLQEFSNYHKINFLWLRKLLIGSILVWIVVIFVFPLGWIFDLYRTGLVGNLIPASVTVFIFFFGYNGIKQGNVFFILDEPEKKPQKRYERSGLKEEEGINHVKILLLFMEKNKPYLDSTLTLGQLSEMIQIPSNHLSQILNEHLQKNFYEFVNGYRVEEFKRRIKQDVSKNFTFLAHALDSGFGSKSTFNEIFKKCEGVSPSAYFKNKIEQEKIN